MKIWCFSQKKKKKSALFPIARILTRVIFDIGCQMISVPLRRFVLVRLVLVRFVRWMWYVVDSASKTIRAQQQYHQNSVTVMRQTVESWEVVAFLFQLDPAGFSPFRRMTAFMHFVSNFTAHLGVQTCVWFCLPKVGHFEGACVQVWRPVASPEDVSCTCWHTPTEDMPTTPWAQSPLGGADICVGCKENAKKIFFPFLFTDGSRIVRTWLIRIHARFPQVMASFGKQNLWECAGIWAYKPFVWMREL